jgi:hypothetical protein
VEADTVILLTELVRARPVVMLSWIDSLEAKEGEAVGDLWCV